MLVIKDSLANFSHYLFSSINCKGAFYYAARGLGKSIIGRRSAIHYSSVLIYTKGLHPARR